MRHACSALCNEGGVQAVRLWHAGTVAAKALGPGARGAWCAKRWHACLRWVAWWSGLRTQQASRRPSPGSSCSGPVCHCNQGVGLL